MRYAQSWQDFMRMPANKALKESKGIHACKQKYIQEQNKMQWHDPVILTENGGGDAGESIVTTGYAGGSTTFITGNTAEVSTVSVISGIGKTGAASDGVTGSLELAIKVNTIAPVGTDFSLGHTSIRKSVALLLVTGSAMGDLGGSTVAARLGYTPDCVVTQSVNAALVQQGGIGGTKDGAWTGSALNELGDAIAAQGATATVLGFTNTIAPSTLITAVTGAAPAIDAGYTLIITNAVKGGVTNATIALTNGGTLSSTASISLTTNGNDQFVGNAGQTFDSQTNPYTSMPFNPIP